MGLEASPGDEVYESRLRLKNLLALSQSVTGAANDELVHWFALIAIGF